MKNLRISNKFALWLLLFYTYFIWMKSIFLPVENFTTVFLLMIVLLIVLINCDFVLKIGNGELKTQAYIWIFIMIYITINNHSLVNNLLKKGMIQNYIMIIFMLGTWITSDWVEKWVKWTKTYALIHSISTIFFYFNGSLYPKFAKLIIPPNDLSFVMRQFNNGWMSGICKNVSANGMVLSICFIVLFQSIIAKEDKKPLDWLEIGLVFFALLLTGKRGPILFIVISFSITYLVQQKNRDGIIKFIKLSGLALIGYLALYFGARHIPAIQHILSKNEELANSNKGVLNGREGLWETAYDMIRSSPIIGHGYNSYSVNASELDLSTTSAHNYYLQLFAELGIIGLIAYIIAFMVGIMLTAKQLKEYDNEKNRLYLSICLSVQIFIVLYGLTASSMMYYYILIPYFISCAVARNLKLNNLSSNHKQSLKYRQKRTDVI